MPIGLSSTHFTAFEDTSAEGGISMGDGVRASVGDAGPRQDAERRTATASSRRNVLNGEAVKTERSRYQAGRLGPSKTRALLHEVSSELPLEIARGNSALFSAHEPAFSESKERAHVEVEEGEI